MGATYIINPNGSSVLIGGKVGGEDYTRCYVAKGEYANEYQGSSDVKITVKANRQLPVYLGARIFPKEQDGAGGYILLSPPSIERLGANHFIYEFTFLGRIHLLETKLLFNQDLKGNGWNLTFSLVGTARDFLDLICTNMNRTLPVEDQIIETWQVGKVDDEESTLLIDFDNDNCLTALKKVSEAFHLPYRTSISGFHEAIITLDLTNECRVHQHIYTIGEGLSKIRILGDADRPFATALHVLGGMQNIPSDYRGGSKRLRTAGGGEPGEMEVMFDDGTTSGAWTTAKDNTIAGVTVDFNSVAAVYHGTKAMKIYHTSSGAITGQGVKMTGGSYDATGATLTFYVYLEADVDMSTARIWVIIGKNDSWKSIQIQDGMYGYNKSLVGQWQGINIPVVDFGLADQTVEIVKIYCTGYWPAGTKLHIDYVFLFGENLETLSFIYNENNITNHGRIEAVTINEDIFPKSSLAITSVVSTYKFIDTSLFDLNEKDEEGNTKWWIDGVTPKVTFDSGNLSGYSFAIKAFDSGTKEIELVPYIDGLDNEIPSPDSEAYQFQAGDKYVITEIRMPDEYMTEAEDDLLEWGTREYQDFSAQNEIAEIEIEPVWVKNVTGLKYTLLGEDPPVEYDIYPLIDLFMAGDLITISIQGLYSRQLKVLSVVHELFSGNLVWKVKLGNNIPVNLAGKLVGEINGAKNKINSSLQNLKLVKYFMG